MQLSWVAPPIFNSNKRKEMNMKKFVYSTYTVYELKTFKLHDSAFKPSILFFSRYPNRGSDIPMRMRIKTSLAHWRFRVHINNVRYRKLQWLIRTPFFMSERNNTYTTFGTPNHYIQFIELDWMMRDRKRYGFASL